MAEPIEPVYYAELDELDKVLSAIEICNLFNHILDR